MNKSTDKRKVLICSLPFSGHYVPMVRIAEALSQHSEFDVTFATSTYEISNIRFSTNKINKLGLNDDT